jgi:hypothetical protein
MGDLMQILTNKKLTSLILITLVLGVFYSGCDESGKRTIDPSDVIFQGQGDSDGKNVDSTQVADDQNLSETNEQNEKEDESSQSFEESEDFQENLESVVKATSDFVEGRPMVETYNFFKEFGLFPEAYRLEYTNKIVIEGTNGQSGMIFFKAEFDEELRPLKMRFEIEKRDQGFEDAVQTLEDGYGNLKPCFESRVRRAVAYQHNGYLLRVKEIDQEDINMGDPEIARVSDQIGNVQVIVEDDIHPEVCGSDISDPSQIKGNHHHRDHHPE